MEKIIESLEGLENYRGKTLVVKYGGAAMQADRAGDGGAERGGGESGVMKDVAMKDGAMEDIARLAAAGAKVVLVHGGGPELSSLQRRLGLETRFVGGLRYTDEETIDAALMALCGKVNKTLVRLLQNEGCRAVGLSGIDGGVLRCVKQDDPDLGFVGVIAETDLRLINVLTEAGFTPVVSTVGLGLDGQAYNINADTAAGSLAAAMKADFFIVMSDIPGIMRDVGDPSSLIQEIAVDEIEGLIGTGVISGGMIPKVRGLAEAVLHGARAAFIIDGREPRALASVLGAGAAWSGTAIVARRAGSEGREKK